MSTGTDGGTAPRGGANGFEPGDELPVPRGRDTLLLLPVTGILVPRARGSAPTIGPMLAGLRAVVLLVLIVPMLLAAVRVTESALSAIFGRDNLSGFEFLPTTWLVALFVFLAMVWVQVRLASIAYRIAVRGYRAHLVARACGFPSMGADRASRAEDADGR